jgi:L-fuconolactonase
LVTECDWRHWTPEQIVPYLDVTFECFGADRLIIGSDWPVCLVAAPYSRAVDVVKNYLDRYTEKTREAVLGGNAQRLWRLKT